MSGPQNGFEHWRKTFLALAWVFLRHSLQSRKRKAMWWPGGQLVMIKLYQIYVKIRYRHLSKNWQSRHEKRLVGCCNFLWLCCIPASVSYISWSMLVELCIADIHAGLLSTCIFSWKSMEWNPYFKGRNGNFQYLFILHLFMRLRQQFYGCGVSIKLAKIIVPL
jgi:hypothetical protein